MHVVFSAAPSQLREGRDGDDGTKIAELWHRAPLYSKWMSGVVTMIYVLRPEPVMTDFAGTAWKFA
jgi:hypothetical protein